MVLHQVGLDQRVREVVRPAELATRGGDAERVPDQEHDWHPGEPVDQPRHEQVGPDLLDQPLAGYNHVVQMVGPRVAHPPGENARHGLDEAGIVVVPAQVLTVREDPGRGNPVGAQRLEDHPVVVVAVDHLADPGGSGPSAAEQEHRVAMAGREVHVRQRLQPPARVDPETPSATCE